jgi:hypothetical protein
MVFNKQAGIDNLVAEMEAALEDKDFRSIFERPVIKTASAEETDEAESNDPVESALHQLMDASATLDDLGLVKSAEKVLIAAQILILEAKKKKKDEDDDDKDDKDKKDKDDKDDDDKDDKKDKKKGKKGKMPPWLNKKKDKDDDDEDDKDDKDDDKKDKKKKKDKDKDDVDAGTAGADPTHVKPGDAKPGTGLGGKGKPKTQDLKPGEKPAKPTR